MEEIDINIERKVIDTYIPMTSLFEKFEIEYSLYGNMFCPFHDNENTPSAHYHQDSNKLWCYSENRMFGSWNLIRVYSPQTNTKKVAMQIIEKHGRDVVERQLESVEFEDKILFLESLEKFKNREISYLECCKEISEHYI